MKNRTIKYHLFSLVLLTFILLSLPAHGKIWYVDSGAPLGGDGGSWGKAFHNIQTAVNAASPLWMICFAPTDQIWVKKGKYPLKSQIHVNKVVSIYGGFNGTETQLKQRDWIANETVVNGNNLVRCFYVTARFCEINGFTITYGRHALSGGGIYIDSKPAYCSTMNRYFSPRIKNCYLKFNTAVTGGGIYITGSDPTIENTTFYRNSAGTGGAIYHLSSSPTIKKCIFRKNQSTAPSSLGGGAIGGFSRNLDINTIATITNSLFYLNTSASWGGAISYNQVYPTITNSTFSSNQADNKGGAFHGNYYSEAPRIRNSIFWEDLPDEFDIVTASTYIDVSYCDVQGGWSGPGTHNIDADPNFSGADDFRLMPGSPCIDTASNAYGPDDDLKNIPRPQDGDGDGSAICDMGAYETPEMKIFCPGDFNEDLYVDEKDMDLIAEDFGRIDCQDDCNGDFNGDDDVDGEGLYDFSQYHGQDCHP